jgi:hypothetical protein
MARPRKVVSIDEKIAKAQEDVAKYKEKYSAAVAEMKDLLAQKEAEKRESFWMRSRQASGAMMRSWKYLRKNRRKNSRFFLK